MLYGLSFGIALAVMSILTMKTVHLLVKTIRKTGVSRAMLLVQDKTNILIIANNPTSLCSMLTGSFGINVCWAKHKTKMIDFLIVWLRSHTR